MFRRFLKTLSRDYPYFIHEWQKEDFWNDLNILVSSFKEERLARDLRYGASLSFCLDRMKDKSWKGLGNVHKFRTTAELAGFKVVPCLDKQGREVCGRFCIRPYKKNIKELGS